MALSHGCTHSEILTEAHTHTHTYLLTHFHPVPVLPWLGVYWHIFHMENRRRQRNDLCKCWLSVFSFWVIRWFQSATIPFLTLTKSKLFTWQALWDNIIYDTRQVNCRLTNVVLIYNSSPDFTSCSVPQNKNKKLLPVSVWEEKNHFKWKNYNN